MATRRQCPRCGQIGFVRAERVIQAGKGVTELSCGACEHTWTEADEGALSQEAERER
jgi:hypothetical protein